MADHARECQAKMLGLSCIIRIMLASPLHLCLNYLATRPAPLCKARPRPWRCFSLSLCSFDSCSICGQRFDAWNCMRRTSSGTHTAADDMVSVHAREHLAQPKLTLKLTRIRMSGGGCLVNGQKQAVDALIRDPLTRERHASKGDVHVWTRSWWEQEARDSHSTAQVPTLCEQVQDCGNVSTTNTGHNPGSLGCVPSAIQAG